MAFFAPIYRGTCCSGPAFAAEFAERRPHHKGSKGTKAHKEKGAAEESGPATGRVAFVLLCVLGDFVMRSCLSSSTDRFKAFQNGLKMVAYGRNVLAVERYVEWPNH
jgi:hypothetical protein